MNLEDKLNLILDYKNDIKNSLIKKGSDIDNLTPLSGYAEKIDNLPTGSSEVEEWTPDPEWWDIETILQEDTFNGSFDGTNPDGKTYKKIIALFDDSSDTLSFKGTIDPANYVGFPYARFSDGTTFTEVYTNKNSRSHTWDKSKDKPSSAPDKKTRYAIFYLPIEDKDYVLTNPADGALSSVFAEAIYIITELKLKYDNGGASCPKLQAIKCIGEGSVEVRGNSYAYSAIWSKTLRFYYIENAHSKASRYQIVAYSGGGNICVKMPPEAYSSIDETTGLKTYDLVCTSSASYTQIKKLDISSITDFSEVSSNLFTTSKIIPSKIEGVIDLSQNVQNTSFTIFNSNLISGTNLGGRVISFELKLPNNADVTINLYKMDYATSKYLVENAPVLTEPHTLTLYTGKNGLDVSKDYLINYNGQLYSDGKKVLELKGWTVNIS